MKKGLRNPNDAIYDATVQSYAHPGKSTNVSGKVLLSVRREGKQFMTRRLTRRRGAYSGYNRRKRQALQIFEEHGWLNPAAFAMLAGMRPIRGVYSYLRRLHGWGLLKRARSPRGLILYRLSEKGARRLAWLHGSRRP